MKCNVISALATRRTENAVAKISPNAVSWENVRESKLKKKRNAV